MTQPENIGVIGLGLVGTALAERLLAGGYLVFGFDIRSEQIDKLHSLGGVGAASVGAVATACPRVILSLPNSDISAQVLEEMRPCLQPGAIVIDTTTGDPDKSCEFNHSLAALGVRYVDATISGSSRQVRAGEAISTCGGEPAVFGECRDIFERCFVKAFHVGPCGSGARMKLVVNLVLGLNRAVLAEGLSFARSIGVEPARALEILQASAAYSRAMDTKGAKMLDEDFTPEARLSQHLKDVRLILALGEKKASRLPLSRAHRELLQRAEAAGFGDVDNSAIIKAFE